MRTLIVYDSEFGNTAEIANALAIGAATEGLAIRTPARNVTADDLDKTDLLIVGSPTQGGRPTQAIQDYLLKLPKQALEDLKVAAFDTRFAINEHGRGLKFLMRTIGFAAPKIAKVLKEKGGQLISSPVGFIVADKEGPLSKGEIQRAEQWARSLARGGTSGLLVR